MSASAKKKNPLYVVSDNGNVVEEASGLVDMIVKKLGLEPLIELLRSVLAMFSAQVGNYGFFLALQEFVDELVEGLENIRSMVKSVLPI